MWDARFFLCSWCWMNDSSRTCNYLTVWFGIIKAFDPNYATCFWWRASAPRLQSCLSLRSRLGNVFWCALPTYQERLTAMVFTFVTARVWSHVFAHDCQRVGGPTSDQRQLWCVLNCYRTCNLQKHGLILTCTHCGLWYHFQVIYEP